MSAPVRHRIIETFTGPFYIGVDESDNLTTGWAALTNEFNPRTSRLDKFLLPAIVDRLAAYFAGESVSFKDVELPGGDSFFGRAWRACRNIPVGRTLTYGALARAAGSPDAARAAGQAMRRNSLPIIVPCHRVVGSSGVLHGFSGSTDPESDPLSVKAALLAHEQQIARLHARESNEESADSLFPAAV